MDYVETIVKSIGRYHSRKEAMSDGSRPWGSPVEVERRNRILIALYAYAYEFEDNPIVSDSEFDDLARKIDLTLKTDHKTLDGFFETHFDPSTGMWIHKHPELEKVKYTYFKFISTNDN